MASRLRALRVVHPFPSILNALLVFGLAVVARGDAAVALVLAVGMLGIQFCIGTVNDLSDRRLDARSKPWKPVAAGLVSTATATKVAVISAIVALVAAASQGLLVVAMALGMLGCGLLYDVRLKPTRWAWACFSVAFALLPLYAWYGAARELPPLSQFLIPLAALAGPALQLSNALVDLERDQTDGIQTLATRLGRTRSIAVIAALLVMIYTVAWATLVGGGSTSSRLAVVLATVTAFSGVALSAARSPSVRAAGWTAQAVAIALLAWGWLSAI